MTKPNAALALNFFILISIILIFIFCIPNNLSAKNPCFIQIEAPAGIEIYLDGKFQGVTLLNEKYFFIQNVTSGKHNISALKDGFYPQIDEIDIKPNTIYEHFISPLIPKIEIKQEGTTNVQEIKKKVGNLLVQSLPIECKISIPSLRIIENKKKKDRWIAKSIPIGTYQIIAQTQNITLDTLIKIKTNNQVQIMFNFVEQTIAVNNVFEKSTYTKNISSNTFDSSQLVNIVISKQSLTISSLFYKLGIVPDSILNNSMLIIAEVRYYSPAYRTKIFAGDVLKRFNGENIITESDLYNKIMKLPSDSTYLLEIEQKQLSNKKYIKTITITLEE